MDSVGCLHGKAITSMVIETYLLWEELLNTSLVHSLLMLTSRLTVTKIKKINGVKCGLLVVIDRHKGLDGIGSKLSDISPEKIA